MNARGVPVTVGNLAQRCIWGENWGQKSARPVFDLAPPADRVPRPLAIRLRDVPSPERICERTPKSLRNQKGATRLVNCVAREPHDPGVHIMKKSLLITVGCGLFASVALAQSPPAGTRAPSAQDFVNKVAISDMFEIQSSQLALSKQADADTKPFAEKMVQDHQKTSSELEGLVEGSMVKLTLPTSLDSEHQNMLNELNSKSGKDFDQTYDQIQVQTHREAVALFEAYSKSGEDSELKTWAGKTLPHLKDHLSMAEKLK
jgi:putative membrane protein